MSIKTAETKLVNPEIDRSEIFELAEPLNQLLSDYMLVYQRLRNYHWNVVGGEFYDVHEKFEEEYLAGAEAVDEIAERMRMLGFKPISTLKGFVEKSHIKENEKEMSAEEMVHQIIKDYQVLLSDLHQLVKYALKFEDFGTDFMARNMMANIEKKIWMFKSFMK